MITLNSGGTAVAPLASKIQVVGALAANMALANVILCKISKRPEQRVLAVEGF